MMMMILYVWWWSVVTVQRVKQCCDAMNCKTELDFTEIDKYFGHVGSLFAFAHYGNNQIRWTVKHLDFTEGAKIV